MAERIAFSVFDAVGAPVTTANPTFLIYVSKTGLARAAPPITHLGGGVYGFRPTDADVDAGVAYLISTGNKPSYLGGTVALVGSPFSAILLVDAVGNLWTGAAPTVGTYADFDGNGRAPPALMTVAPHFFLLVPTAGDISVGTAYRVDANVAAQPRYTSGSFFVPVGVSPTPPAASTAFEAFEAAVQATVVAATGYAGNKVIWADQTRDRPIRPFIELKVVSDSTYEHSALTVRDNPTPSAGQEILLDTTDHRNIAVQMRIFSTAMTGSNRAVNVGNKIRQYLNSESGQGILGDIGMIDRSIVQDATIVLETEHEGRAVFTATFRLGDTFTEATTYIQTVVLETTVQQTSGNVVYTTTISA